MKTPSKWAVTIAAIAALGVALALPAQVTTRPVVKIKEPKPPRENFKGEVVNWTPVAVTVRDPKNTTKVRTFTFTADLQKKMEGRHIENGGKVTVVILKGSNTAVAIKGKVRRY